MKKAMFVLFLATGAMLYSSCKSTPKKVEQNQNEEVIIDSSDYSSIQEEE
jgi:hypothetical protein